jgi:hypothetical protein
VPWLPALAEMLALRVPVLLTSYHRGESDGEQELLLGVLGATQLTAPIDCATRHSLPVDAISERSFASSKAEWRTADATTQHQRQAEAAEFVRLGLEPPPRLAESVDGCDMAELARAHYDWHNNPPTLRMKETCNSRIWWVRGSESCSRDELTKHGLPRVHAILRQRARLFGLCRLHEWLSCIVELAKIGHAATWGKFDEASVEAELMAEATEEAQNATAAARMGAHLVLKLCVFVAKRAASVPREEHDLERCYTGVGSFERFQSACSRALHNVEAALGDAPEAPSDANVSELVQALAAAPDAADAGIAGLLPIHPARCARCTKPATMCCTKCKGISYCSESCLAVDWKDGHELVCSASEWADAD